MLKSATQPLPALENTHEFRARHIGPDEADERHMLSVIGAASRRALIEAVVPRSIARIWRSTSAIRRAAKPRSAYCRHGITAFRSS